MQNTEAPACEGVSAVKASKTAIAAALLGNAVEFYDFVVYVFFAAHIGRSFFAASDPVTSVLMALAVFGVGFVARPVGAIVLGHYADRRGRRPAMLTSMWLMTAATCAIAVLPTYKDIGQAATLLLVLSRLVQGFCFGGELGPSLAFLCEAAPAHRRGLCCAGLFAGQGLAVCAAGILGTTATWLLSKEQMQDWGWRLLFFFAALATPLALILRRQMPESLPQHKGTADLSQGPRVGRVVALTLAILGGTVANYVCTYLPTHASITLGMQAVDAISVSIVVGVVTLAFGLLGGWMADTFDRRLVLLTSRLVCAVLAVPLFSWLSDARSPQALWVTAALLAGANAINGGALFVLMAESFGAARRATSISIIYAAGVAVFGGSTQFVVAWLGSVTASAVAPAWYLAATGLVAFAALWSLRGSEDGASRSYIIGSADSRPAQASPKATQP